MNELTLSCPHCSGEFVVTDEQLGQVVECPLCSKTIQLPDPEPVAEASEESVREDETPKEEQFDALDLQRAADWHTVTNYLKGAGIASIIFGGWAIYLGISTQDHSNGGFSTLALVVGGLMIIEGVWVKLCQSKIGLFADGVVLLLVAALNFWGMVTGGGPNFFAVALMMFQFHYASQCFRRHRRISKMDTEKPEDKLLERLKELLARTQATDQKAPEALFINTTGAFGIPITLKALLEPDIAVLVTGGDSFFARRKDLQLKIHKLNIAITFRGRKLIKGILPENKIEALQTWHKSRESWLASSFYQATAAAVADAGLDPLEYKVIDSLSEVESLSQQSCVMLFVVKAGNDENVRKTFDNDILPRITPAFSMASIAICWANIGGSGKTSELAAHLKEKKLKPGCFFFKNGALKDKKAVPALNTGMDYVNSAMALVPEQG